jgi:vesicle-associated membrane protein 7
MPILYAWIQDGILVVEYPVGEQSGLSATLQTVIREQRRQPLEDAEVNYHYRSNDDGRIVACATAKDVTGQVAFAFLEDLIRLPNADLRNDRETILQRQMDYFNDPANGEAIQQKSKDHFSALITKLTWSDMAPIPSDAYSPDEVAVFRSKADQLKRKKRRVSTVAMVVGASVVGVIMLLMIVCKPNFNDCR